MPKQAITMWKQKYAPREEQVTQQMGCNPVDRGGLYYIRSTEGGYKSILK